MSDKPEVHIKAFDGGLNTKVTPYNGDLSQSPDLDGVIFDDYGAVETARGKSQFNTTTLGVAAAAVNGLFTYYDASGYSHMMAVCEDTLYQLKSGSTFDTVASAVSVFTAGYPTQWVNMQNKVFISDGHVEPYKYDGTYFTRWGVTTQDTAATAAVNSAGTQTGKYRYVVFGCNSHSVYGDYATATTEVSLTSQRAYVTEIPVWPASHGVDTKYICRNTAGVSGVYYVVTHISNAITAYEDNKDDDELLVLAPTDNGLPAKFTTMIEHQGRIWGACATGSNPTYLYYSNINDPEIFSAVDFVRIGEGDGLPITGIAVLGGHLIISKCDEKGNGVTYMLYTPDGVAANWVLKKLNCDFGNIAPGAMKNFSNFLSSINKNGIYSLNDAALGSIDGAPISFDIESEVLNMPELYIKNCFAIAWKNKLWISVPYGTTTKNNYVFVYDYVKRRYTTEKQGAWSKYSDWNIGQMTIYGGSLYGASSTTNGTIYKLDTSYGDCGVAYDNYIKTMGIQGAKGDENKVKIWRFVDLVVESSGSWYMGLDAIPEFDTDDSTTYLVDLSGGTTSLWDGFSWDIGVWSGSTARKNIRICLRRGIASKVLQLKFYGFQVNQYWKIHDIKVSYNIRSER